MPRLSICIPTYNRSAYLAELLDSIIAQGNDDIEVIVSDDASPDDTAAVAQGYVGRIANYTFIRQPRNIGLDRNFLAVVAAATGDYIWLMGDDDRLEQNGVRIVFDALDRWPGISGLTLGVIDYDVTMTRRTGVRGMPPTQRIEAPAAVFGMIAELLGFMSALVVDRARWQAVADDPAVTNFQNYYIQVYIVGQVIERFGGWGIVHESCVGFRSGNDQFKVKFGWFKRLTIDVIAYDQIADALFADDPVARGAMRKRIFDTHVMARLRNAKTAGDRMPDVVKAATFLFGHYGGMLGYWTKALPTLAAPKWAMVGAQKAYKRFVKGSGAARARALR